MTARIETAGFFDGKFENKLYIPETELRTEHTRIRTIVLRSTVYDRADVRALVDSYGFAMVGSSGPYVILVK